VPETGPLTTQIWYRLKSKFPSQKSDWERFIEKNIFFSGNLLFMKTENNSYNDKLRLPNFSKRTPVLLLIPCWFIADRRGKTARRQQQNSNKTATRTRQSIEPGKHFSGLKKNLKK
jgi:hypothetical protein